MGTLQLKKHHHFWQYLMLFVVLQIPLSLKSQTYCSAGASNCDEYISKVELNTISKSSGCGLGSNGISGYSDYTNILTVLTAGNSYTLTVYNGNHYNGDYFDAYIDWNNDKDFTDANEYLGSKSTSPSSFTINVPVGLTYKGKTVLRIRCRYQGSHNSCGVFSWGEVEDYSVELVVPYHHDAGVISVDSPAVPVRPGTVNIKARIKNYGLDTLKSAGIDWKADTSNKTGYSWTGSLATGQTSSQLLLGNHHFPVGAHTIKAWTKNPNNVNDSNKNNDTFIYSFYVCNALSGTYTIGPDATDSFPNFTAAVQRLVSCGVNGPVTFVADTGTYNEHIRIPAIQGASSSNTITFKSAVSDSSKVKIVYSASDLENNYVVMLDGADYIRFERISFRANGTNYARTVYLTGGACNNIFQNNQLQSTQAFNFSEDFAIVYSDDETDTSNTFLQNYFLYGSYGVCFYGGVDDESYNKFIGNHFKEQYYFGIFLENQSHHEIKYNLIESSTSVTFYGIYLYFCTEGFVNSGNSILLPDATSGGYGIFLDMCYGDSALHCLTANNFIHIPSVNNNAYGIYHYYSEYQDIVYNSINITGNYSNSFGFYYSGSNFSNCTFRNNISVNQANGYSIYCSNTSGISSDYNNLFTTGSRLGYWATNIINLTSWISTTKQDSHSLSVLPQFFSASNLHLKDINLNGKAKPFAGVAIDIDQENRSSSLPDIGADEFDLNSVDVGILTIDQPVTPAYPGNTAVKVRFRNFGADTIKSAQIDWKYDGNSGTTYNWSGSLKSGDTSSLITLGNVSVSLGTHTLKAWTKNPNTQTDQFAPNDTQEITFQSCIPLNGTYTIGPNPGDSFSSLTAAVNALINRCGVSGPVVFKIASGTYNEQVYIPSIMGASSTNTITFESVSGDSSTVIITYAPYYSSSNYVLMLDGADYIIFKNVTIKNTSSYYSRVVWLNNGACHNQIKNCCLTGYNTTSTSNNMTVVYIYDTGNESSENNLFSNNLILNGSIGFYLYSTTSIKPDNNRFISNVIQDPYYIGFLAYNQNSPVFEKNFISTVTNYSNFYGFYLYSCDNESSILSNKIQAPYCGGGMGLILYYCNGSSSKKGLIANNFIYLGNSSNNVYGIYINSCYYQQIFYNSVNLKGTYSSGAGLYYNSWQSNTGNILLNNNICNQTGSFAVQFEGVSPDSSDHNNYYTTGTNLGNYLGTPKNNLSAWQSSSGKDLHSVSVFPDFVSNSDLHISNLALDGKALPVANVTKDIDDETRHTTTPDIGADEFVPPANDAGIIAITDPSGTNKNGQYAVKVTLKNHGTDTLKNVSIEWKINGTSQTTYNWSGTLPPNQSVSNLSLGNFTFSTGTYTIKAWTKNPNNTTDGNKNNDTQLVTVKFSYLCDTFTIGGSGASFPGFKSAVDSLIAYGICGPVVFIVNSGTYTEQISIPYISGSSAVNTITFISSANDSTAVKLTYTPSSYTDNYVIKMSGAKYFRFYKMTFLNPNTSYSRVIVVDNYSSDNQFQNCIFEGSNNTSTSNDRALIYSDASIDSNFIFIGNLFVNGSMGLYWYGSNYESGMVIKNNVFLNQYYIGIYNERHDGILIEGNTFETNTTYYYYGIYLYSIRYSSKIIKNKIIARNSSGGYGIYIYNATGQSDRRVLVANNFIIINANGNSSYGIYSAYNQYSDVFYNSVNITGYYNYSYAFYISTYTYYNNRVKNNNFINNAGGYAYYCSMANTFTSDYNNLKTNGSYLGFFSSQITNLSAWQSVTSMDSNSISADPEYFSATDLHSFSKNINGKAQPVAEVDIDIDGDARDTLNSDIGADEFTPPNLDAGIIALDEPGSPCQKGSRTFKVSIKNFASDTLKSVTVEWQIDGTSKTAYNWSGSLPEGDTAIAVTIGTAYLSWGTHNIKIWTKNPNNSIDGNKLNDTLSISLTAKNPLNGIYTIGSSSTDSFASFTEAVDSLMTNGISGSVIFRVKDGTYTEQIVIGNIDGVSAEKTITFQSYSYDSTKVILQYNSTNYDYNYVILLNGARFITFKKLTLKSLNSYYGSVIKMVNSASNNSILNNIIIRPSINSTSDYDALIYISYDNCNDNQYISNVLKNGSFGLLISGKNYSERMKGTVILNNTFDNMYYAGLFLYYQTSPQISGNYIATSSANYTYGMYLYYCNEEVRISENKIQIGFQGYGVTLYYCEGTNAIPVSIYNNFISITGSSSGRGIYCYGSYYVNFYYNNINITNTSNTSGYCIGLYYGGNNRLKNNILCNKGDGYAIYAYSNYSLVYSDYNNLYAKGQYLAYWGGNSKTDLASWNSSSGYDNHSVSIDPLFYSSTDLHVSEITLNAAASPVSGITKDIDNETRNSVTPDIGADEFTPPSNDAGLVALLNPVKPFVADTYAVTVRLRNYGSDTLKSVTINWKINGVTQTPYYWSGSLKSADTVYVIIGNAIFSLGTTYQIQAWTTLPNGLTDNNLINDSIVVPNLSPALSGVYTIGGSNPDFTSFTSAVNSLKLGGILGNVVFNVRNGVYTEQLDITEITGTSASNTIIFQSESLDSTKVVLQYSSNSSNNYTIRFNGVDYLTFRYMTLKALNGSYGRVIELTNNALNCSLKNNLIIGSNYSSTSSDNFLIFNNYQIVNNLTISGNVIRKGASAIWLYGPSGYQQNTLIEKNVIDSISYIAIYAYNQSYLVIKDNYINLQASTYNYMESIELDYCYNRTVITGNRIIQNDGFGLYLYNVQGNSNEYNLIANNFIAINGTYTYGYGMYNYYTYYSKFYYNSINVYHTSSSSDAFYIYGGSNVNVVNNIFSCKTGYAYYVSSTSTISTSNYNNFYTGGTYLAYWNGNISTLTGLKAASGKDANSISKDPLFNSNNDLHVQEVALNKAATPIAEVTVDIDGEPRDNTRPDIGADEFTPPLQDDAGINDIVSPTVPFPADTNLVRVVLTNYGADTLKSVTIKWKVNGVSQNDYNWSGSLLTGNSDTVTIGKFDFNIGTAYQIKVYSVNPNGNADSFNTNDTMLSAVLYAALNGTYTIGGSSPDFNSFSDAVNILNNGGILGNVIFNVRNGIYTERVKINSYPGTLSSRSVVFQSESGDSTQVFLSWNTDNDNYTLYLDGADYITFRKMTIRTTASSGYYGTVIQVSNDAVYNTFSGNVVQGYNGNVTSTSYSVFNIQGGNNHHLNLLNNVIQYGSFGVYIIGSSSSGSAGVQIKGNIIQNAVYYGIYAYYHDGLIIENNVINLSSYYSYSIGVYLYDCRNATKIAGNKISVPAGYYGIYLSNSNGTSTYKGNIYNNFIYVGGNTSNPTGLYLYYSSYHNVYFNNINITSGSATGSRALYLYSVNNINLLNNNIVNRGAGYAYYISTASGITSGYNNIYSKGNYLAYYNGNISSLAAWKSATGLDATSISVDPQYVSNSDLHVREITLNEAGTPIAGITADIDGEARHASKPDIGADEFEAPYSDDAGIVSFIEPAVPFPADTLPVKVLLKNFGYDTLTTVTIKWSVNGISQTPKSWSGSILPGRYDTVVIGNYIFKTVIAYNLVAYTYNPNGVRDSLNTNDTARTLNLYAALSGTYTIGGSNPDFISFGAAANILNLGGVVGAVVFNVRTGVYNEQLSIGQIPGSSSVNQITFQSEGNDSNLVTLTYQGNSSDNYVLRLNGADYVTFKKMTFQPIHNYYARGVELLGGANYNKFRNCRFEGVSTTNSSDFFSNVYSSGDNDIGNEFSYNVFNNGSFGIRLYGLSGSYESGTYIYGNIFENQSVSGVFLYGQSEPVIAFNTFSSSVNNYQGAISINTANNGPKIYGNKISSEKSAYSLQLYDADGSSSNKMKIYNNFFQLGGTASSSAVVMNFCDYTDFIYNSINVSNTHTGSRALFVENGNANVVLQNNIFANTGGGYACYISNTSAIVYSNYNDHYSAGSVLGYWGGNRTDLSAWRSASGQDNNSKSLDPLFYSTTDLHISQVLLDSAAVPVTGITKDIDNQNRNTNYPDIGADEFTYVSHDVGISAVIAPVSGCGLSSDTVRVKIQNFGGQSQSNFNVYYKFDNQQVVVRNIGSLTIPKGSSYVYKFDTVLNISTQGNHTLICWTNLSGDTIHSNDTFIYNFSNYPYPGAISNMLPVDTAQNVALPVTFSWSPASGANSYDLYIWPETENKPVSPTVANITQITYTYNGSLQYGKTYKWQIVAKSIFCQTAGNIQKFTVRYLPDLIVNSVTVPSTAYSGQTFNVSWQIKNTGTGSTLSTEWFDVAYLSSDTNLDENVDFYLGAVSNLSSLGSGVSYNQTETFTIPQGLSGNYYVILITDKFSALTESNENNNKGYNSSTLQIQLTPPPDLQVISIVRPNTIYSGTNANVSWTVQNKGTGNTVTNYWYDALYLGQDTTFDPANCYYLGNVYHNGQLLVNSTYNAAKTVSIPNAIFGTYYIFVKTDYFNSEYEHAWENNNVKRSDAISIILTPPPDLVVTGTDVPDSASNNETLGMSYYLKNQGGNDPESSWYDKIYISASRTFSESGSILLATRYHSQDLSPGQTDTLLSNITIPTGINGKYYIFVKTDCFNSVYEYTYENNNVSDPDSIYIKSPDLTVSWISNPATAYSGTSINIKWKDKNTGPGKIINRGWKDKIYISPYSTFNSSTAVFLQEITIASVSMNVNNEYLLTSNITIPNGYSGVYYLYIATDAVNNVFEAGGENNNTKKADTSITVTLSPWPDLQVVEISAPDTATAGDPITVHFTVTNKGTATATGSSWKDNVFISKDSVFNSSTASLLKDVIRPTSLAVSDSYNITTMAGLATNLTAGIYYLHVYTDYEDKIYEHTSNSNNSSFRPIYIKAYPPVDFMIYNVTCGDTGSSGKTFAIAYSVKNIGQGKSLAPSYKNAVYLSTDSIWSPATDILINREDMTTQLAANASYTKNINVTLPNGITGNYYLLVVTDENNNNNDVNLSNNYRARTDAQNKMKKIFIKLTLTPDLKPTSVNSPATGTSGQPVTVTWTVKNQGQAATSVTFEDRIYLSADFTIDGSDVLLGSFQRTSSLAVNSSYNQSQQVFLPANITGNRIILLKTDATDAEYEHNGEDNNIMGAPISITAAPPCDLIVSHIGFPLNAVAGKSATITYKIKNTGVNPATGYIRDAIYISKDNQWDVNDVLFGTNQYTIGLSPNTEVSKNMTKQLKGVTLGYYYVIVRTDILTNINETNDNNNEKISVDTMKVNVQNLPWYTMTYDTLYDNSEVYFKLESHDTLKSETLLLNLYGDSVNGDNELYLSYLKVPTRNVYDYAYSEPFHGNQEIIVPSLEDSTYYIMVYGYTMVGSMQKIGLMAKILHFEVRGISANQGGNTGKVTVIVSGSKFDTTMTVILQNDSAVYEPDTLVYVDPTKVFVTYNLAGAKLGKYDVVAIKTSKPDTAKLMKGFEIVNGVASDLQVSISKPANVRPSAITAMSLDFANVGNTDIDVPTIILKSLALAPVGMSVPDLENKKTELTFMLKELNGPQWVIRPGAYGSVLIYTKSTAGLGFQIMLPEIK